MTIFIGSKADEARRQIGEQVVLPSNFAITAADGIFENVTGLTFQLPFEGTYLLMGNIEGAVEGSSGSDFFIKVRAFNTTDSAAVADSDRLVVSEAATSVLDTESLGYMHIVTVKKPTTMILQAARGGDTSPAWTLSLIASASTKTTFGFIQLV